MRFSSRKLHQKTKTPEERYLFRGFSIPFLVYGIPQRRGLKPPLAGLLPVLLLVPSVIQPFTDVVRHYTGKHRKCE